MTSRGILNSEEIVDRYNAGQAGNSIAAELRCSGGFVYAVLRSAGVLRRQRIAADNLEARFWSRVECTPTCWVWTGYKERGQRYGKFITRAGEHERYAHRVSWEMHFGPIPDGLEVCHRCDVPSCVRPDHLFLGTHAENMADMARKGRWTPRRVRSGPPANAKLTPDDVRAIRLELPSHTFVDIAKRWGVSINTISRIASGLHWKTVL